MLKKIILFLCLSVAAPCFAMKNIGGDFSPNQTPIKVEVRSVDNAQEITIRQNRTLTQAFLGGITCHEYTRNYTNESSGGLLYTRRYTRSVKRTSEPTDFLRKIVDENPDNLYFKSYGYGLYARPVGELFVGNMSVNRHMVEKGYCSMIQN